ncbi:hypothetical protein [Arthrobacter sp. zg-Y238]|uniref:hypothetical protein n=1 Tax=Arthrobacter sp. zg-Y238 TaxID=2964614 RepID=UPI0021059CE5|nr:hypothetical protein [Arthrobacter sp. zg-Y238]MCQ1953764.1 hypothetical protein [Arthrobacter sp. zg-Y238]
MSTRMNSGTLLTVGVICLMLTGFSTFAAFAYEFEMDPDHSACYYRRQIPRRQWVLAASLVLPAVAAAAGTVALILRPRQRERIAPSLTVVAAAGLAIWINWAIGIDAIEHSQRLAGTPPAPRFCPEDLEGPGSAALIIPAS